MDPTLYNSARTGNSNHIQQLLSENPALHIAARDGKLSVVNILVSNIVSSAQGDIVNGTNGGIELLRMRNSENSTILHEALKNRQLEVVNFLLEADPGLAELNNNACESPLYLSARDGMLEVVNRILMLAPLTGQDGPDGQTTLDAAAAGGHFDIIEVLLRAKPQLINEIDHKGWNVLHYAAYSGDNIVVQCLLKVNSAIAYALDKDGQSPLHIAARKGHIKVVKEIILRCPDSGELLDFDGRNALHTAIQYGKVNVVRHMLHKEDLNAVINQADRDGNTPLHLATLGRNTLIVRYLIWDGRVDQRAKNKNGETARDIYGFIKEHGTTFPGIPSFLFAQIIDEKVYPHSRKGAVAVETYKQMGNTLLMVATLIATVTFTAAFTMPGGYNNNIGPDQGLALLHKSKSLKWFIVSDSVAMTCSLNAVCILLWGYLIARESYVYYFASAMLLTYIALQATFTAFASALKAVMPDAPLTLIIIIDMAWSLFHISTCFFLYQLVKTFTGCEVYQLFIFRLCKFKAKFSSKSL